MVHRVRRAPPVHRARLLHRGSRQRPTVQARSGTCVASRRRDRRGHHVLCNRPGGDAQRYRHRQPARRRSRRGAADGDRGARSGYRGDPAHGSGDSTPVPAARALDRGSRSGDVLRRASSHRLSFFRRRHVGADADRPVRDARSQAARVAALAAERSVLEGDLRAMQARVDPDLLFDTLLAVDRAYARSIRFGEDALDALIGFLRAALPAEAVATSTVARELEHVRAYLAVRELLSASRPEVEMGAEPAARETPMPAMLMLPLVRWALDGRPAARLELRVRRREGALGISVESDLAEAVLSPAGDLAGVRKRLMHLYQERGRLDVSTDAGKRRAVMEIPL